MDSSVHGFRNKDQTKNPLAGDAQLTRLWVNKAAFNTNITNIQ